MSNNSTPVKGNRSSRLDTGLGPRSSSSGMLTTTSLRSHEHDYLFGFNHQPRDFFSDIEYVTPTKKRTDRDESNTSSISSAFPDIGSVCSTPVLLTSNSQQSITVAKQTSPSAQCQLSASLDKIDEGYLYGHKPSEGRAMRRIKNKLQNLCRSLSTTRLSSNRSDDSESLLENMNEAELQISEDETFITSRLLEKCSHDTFIIQFCRRFPSQELGIFFSMDRIGLYICRLAKKRHLESIREYLQVKDRIVSLQGIPAYHLNVADVRAVLRGCHVITVKIVRPFRR